MEIKRDVYLEQFNIGRHRTKGEDEAAEYN